MGALPIRMDIPCGRLAGGIVAHQHARRYEPRAMPPSLWIHVSTGITMALVRPHKVMKMGRRRPPTRAINNEHGCATRAGRPPSQSYPADGGRDRKVSSPRGGRGRRGRSYGWGGRPQGIAPTEGAHKGTLLRMAPTRDRPYGWRPQGIAPTGSRFYGDFNNGVADNIARVLRRAFPRPPPQARFVR